jgi:hypothetical protein
MQRNEKLSLRLCPAIGGKLLSAATLHSYYHANRHGFCEFCYETKAGVGYDAVAPTKKELTERTKRFILFFLRGWQTKRFVKTPQAGPNKFFNN